ncbi:hypothetical protein BEP19_07165 [Ammoniphilus oxalaticus]|uniref:16S rRNA processing protein RimM n=1 Tax=Ammoniphilus oxalaticus TaxID=66863 RepID=A0A419SJR6_9BACL|nr:YlqD family protein [Ammoniphilus oxalaticus]RKD24179.1 hypothetical protein BEP19_07165 [Ammoniphilus oxalaticus]
MKIKRPVVVKMILTDQLRTRLKGEYEQTIKQVQIELEQLQFRSKKLLQDSAKQGPEAYRIVQERLQKEEQGRRDKLKRAYDLQNQLDLLPDGREIVHSQVESEVEVKIGDDWDKLINQTEIIIKDGIVVEIRR